MCLMSMPSEHAQKIMARRFAVIIPESSFIIYKTIGIPRKHGITVKVIDY